MFVEKETRKLMQEWEKKSYLETLETLLPGVSGLETRFFAFDSHVLTRSFCSRYACDQVKPGQGDSSLALSSRAHIFCCEGLGSSWYRA